MMSKRNYRLRVRRSLDGIEIQMTVAEIKNFLSLVIEKTNQSLKLAQNEKGQLATYFYHEVTKYKTLGKKENEEQQLVKPLEFKKHALPLFLEGYVHALKVQPSVEDARTLYKQVIKSDLYDKKLKMFKVNTDLSKQTEEIGRTRIFPSGWLENESVWLHMEYKFLLEILRSGLHDEFYDNFKNVLVPFLKPEQYGRSILENSSFIASSVHEDENIHGQGFVARLSGSTAEFLHIWLVMNMGQNPFSLNAKKELNLTFYPILSNELFTKVEETVEFIDFNDKSHTFKLPKNTYAFRFLNSTLVVYHNSKRQNTFGKNGATAKENRNHIQR